LSCEAVWPLTAILDCQGGKFPYDKRYGSGLFAPATGSARPRGGCVVIGQGQRGAVKTGGRGLRHDNCPPLCVHICTYERRCGRPGPARPPGHTGFLPAQLSPRRRSGARRIRPRSAA
jgi:hypothetical protein